MNLLCFAVGIILGLLIRDIKFKAIEKVNNYREDQENKGKAEFIESIGFKEKFEKAKSVDDLLDK